MNTNEQHPTEQNPDQLQKFWQKKTTRRTAFFSGLGILAAAGLGSR